MRKQYSIAAAKDNLPGIVHEVEQNGPVELTRRGKPVAVLLSVEEYERLQPRRGGFYEALMKWREEADLEGLWAEGDPFEGVRDRTPGREVNFE